MPVLFQEPIDPPGEWGLWHIDESEQNLRDLVHLYPSELAQIDLIRGQERRREFLAARLLLHQMSGRNERSELVKDPDGKPHLTDSLFYVSISHTVGYSAAIAHPQQCGVDVQRIVARIRRIAPKFVNRKEQVQLTEAEELTQLHLIWSAKEAMYKAYGRRQLDFREHLFVELGEVPTGQLRTAKVAMEFDLHFKVYENFVLVGAVKK